MDRSAFVTMREARELLGVSNYTIWRMVKEGRLRTYELPTDRRVKLVLRSDLEPLRKVRIDDSENARGSKAEGA